MKEFYIGQIVSFDHVAAPEYIARERKIVNQRIKPLYGVVTGQVVKREGTYHSGGGGGVYGDGDFDPPYLSISRDVRLWEVRTGMRNKPLHVADEHIQAVADDTLIGLNTANEYVAPFVGPTPSYIMEYTTT